MLLFIILALGISRLEGAKILAVFPTPSISHQIVFRPLTKELAQRGHEVIVVTPDPAFPKGQTPKNLIEIDVHNVSYAVKNKLMSEAYGNEISLLKQFKLLSQMFFKVFEIQMKNEEFQKILGLDKNYFDLLLVEACVSATLGLSHMFNAPIIQVSSLGTLITNHQALGIPMHPFVYPTSMRNRLYNLTMTEKLREILELSFAKYVVAYTESAEHEMLRNNFGNEVPTLWELTNNIDMLFINTHPMWGGNYPVPPNVIFMGGIHQRPLNALPKDLQLYLDSSKNGVIYVSFGTNVKSETFSPKTRETLVKVFSDLPYDVLWKWNQEEPALSENIKIFKWLPQADLLHHAKIKLFITQGGLQSTEEAITAGVPLIGMPVFVDQAFNTEKYVHFNIGLKLTIETLTEQKLRNAIEMVIGDESYRRNIEKLRTLMNDQPQSPLERTVWWTEYVLRNGGARHLRSPAANMSWMDYLEIELLFVLSTILIIVLISIFLAVKCLLSMFSRCFVKSKLKTN